MQTEMLPDIVRRVDRRQPACRSALPQAAFLPRKNSAGLFGEGKSDDDKEENRRNTCVFQGSMTQSALICTWGPRKVARPCGERRTHHSGEGCPLGSARLKRRLRPTKKRVCPCQAKVWCKMFHVKHFGMGRNGKGACDTSPRAPFLDQLGRVSICSLNERNKRKGKVGRSHPAAFWQIWECESCS